MDLQNKKDREVEIKYCTDGKEICMMTCEQADGGKMGCHENYHDPPIGCFGGYYPSKGTLTYFTCSNIR